MISTKDEGVAAILPALGFRRIARFAILSLIAIGAVAAWRWRALLDPVTIASILERYPAMPLGFLAVHVAASLLFIPRTLLAITAGMLFGVGWGIFWAELGSTAGAAVGFLIARYISAGWIDLEHRARIGPILQRVERGGWRSVAMLRLIPVMPHSLANYGLGLTRLPFGAYTIGSLIGQLPMTIAYVELGAAGERLMLGSAYWIEPTLIGLAVLSLSLMVPVVSRRRAR